MASKVDGSDSHTGHVPFDPLDRQKKSSAYTRPVLPRFHKDRLWGSARATNPRGAWHSLFSRSRGLFGLGSSGIAEAATVVILLSGCMLAAQQPAKPIQIQSGKLQGLLSSDHKLVAYKGIPYAA